MMIINKLTNAFVTLHTSLQITSAHAGFLSGGGSPWPGSPHDHLEFHRTLLTTSLKSNSLRSHFTCGWFFYKPEVNGKGNNTVTMSFYYGHDDRACLGNNHACINVMITLMIEVNANDLRFN